MDKFFNMDNKFFSMMGRAADLMILNIVFIICCLPIVTIGASLTALHYVTLKMVRNEESYIVKSFFKSFKQNFKQATIINLIMLLFGGLLYLDLNIINNMSGSMASVLHVLFIAFGIVYFVIFLYLYPVLAKFYNTIKHTFRNAFLMSIRHLPYTVLMALITAAPVAIFFIPTAQVQSIVLLLFILMGFSLEAFINGHFLVKIFDNYIIETPSKTSDTEESSEQTPAV